MTVIDAAIQGVPEQAKRRLRTVTSHFSVRRPPRAKARDKAAVSGSAEGEMQQSSISLDERGLDLSSSTAASLEDPNTTGTVMEAE